MDPKQQEFAALVDQLIAVANQQLEQSDCGVIANAMLAATARFAAFYAAASSESKTDLAEDKNDIIQHFGAEFKRNLADDIQDYIDNYKTYTRGD